ncbi:C39 family peptidase [Paenibacillus soyae]|uniref:C39 family peptidase n=1 Tax=Paenibacillus soyae TaxID=2969249 RepID=A0A9X2MTR9_9BACL|nr:C39 family peptidase [Paenibacillus soyae]MCR2807853.1 C39 family peptidase [Paenibacillus soyae]
MKRLILLMFAVGLIVVAVLVAKEGLELGGGGAGPTGGAGGQAESTPNVVEEVIEQGTITIIHTDSASQHPIPGTEFEILDGSTNRTIETVTTDANGRAVTSPLDYGDQYVVKQSSVMAPFELSLEPVSVSLQQEEKELAVASSIPAFVKGYAWGEDGKLNVSEVYIDEVPVVMQKPELPNGCEITSLTAVLNGLGFDLTKENMADNYLPQEPFYRKDGKLYGADPNKAYAGNPRDKIAWFSYAPPIIEAANKVFDQFGGDYTPVDLTGSTREQIYAELDAGRPVVIWVTLDLSPPKVTSSWYFNTTGELFKAPVNLHCVVLNGYNRTNNTVHVMNPLQGQVTYDADQFFASYDALGTHALVIR